MPTHGTARRVLRYRRWGIVHLIVRPFWATLRHVSCNMATSEIIGPPIRWLSVRDPNKQIGFGKYEGCQLRGQPRNAPICYLRHSTDAVDCRTKSREGMIIHDPRSGVNAGYKYYTSEPTLTDHQPTEKRP